MNKCWYSLCLQLSCKRYRTHLVLKSRFCYFLFCLRETQLDNIWKSFADMYKATRHSTQTTLLVKAAQRAVAVMRMQCKSALTDTTTTQFHGLITKIDVAYISCWSSRTPTRRALSTHTQPLHLQQAGCLPLCIARGTAGTSKNIIYIHAPAQISNNGNAQEPSTFRDQQCFCESLWTQKELLWRRGDQERIDFTPRGR